jgi:ethanolamine utilization protein EutP
MKRVMLIGSTGAGKTTLKIVLANSQSPVMKTQAIVFDGPVIDTPGEYMDNPRLYRALLSTAAGVETIIFVQDAARDESAFPPGFARAFPGMTIGVVTKIDLAGSEAEKAERFLEGLALKGPVFKVSSVTGEGMDELKTFIGI